MISQLCISSWSWVGEHLKHGCSVEEFLERAAELGVDGVDFTEDFLLGEGASDQTVLRSIKAHANDCGIRILSTWFYTDIVGAAKAFGVVPVADIMTGYIAKAALLGSPFLAFSLGQLPVNTDPKECENLAAEVFSILAPRAKEHGVRLLINPSRASGIISTPKFALDMVRILNDAYLAMAPDFEAWRLSTEDLPLVHAENPNAKANASCELPLFEACMPFSPLIHAKMMGFDDNGNEPHFPIDGLMKCIQRSPVRQVIDIEYEGWIPELNPDIHPYEGVRSAITLINRYR